MTYLVYFPPCKGSLTLELPKSRIQNFHQCNFLKNVKSKLYHIDNSKTRGQTLDEVVYDEQPHQDLHCLQIQLFSSLVVKELKDLEIPKNFCQIDSPFLAHLDEVKEELLY